MLAIQTNDQDINIWAGAGVHMKATTGAIHLDGRVVLGSPPASAPSGSVVAATINADWNEGGGTGGEAAVGDCCWRWRRRPADPNNPGAGAEWAFSHSDFSVASFGNYGSLVSYGYKAEDTFAADDSGGNACRGKSNR